MRKDAGCPTAQSLMLVSIGHLKGNCEPGALEADPGNARRFCNGAVHQGDNPDCKTQQQLSNKKTNGHDSTELRRHNTLLKFISRRNSKRCRNITWK
jgi:hypothetical protein